MRSERGAYVGPGPSWYDGRSCEDERVYDSRFGWKEGFTEMRSLCEDGCSLRQAGMVLSRMMIHSRMSMERGKVVRPMWSLLAGGFAGGNAVHRPLSREAYPLTQGRLAGFVAAMRSCCYEAAVSETFVREWAEDSWLFLSATYCNYLYGYGGLVKGRWKKCQVDVVGCLRCSVQRALSQDFLLKREYSAVEKELSSRFVSYTGEEIPKMEPLSLAQISPALPPASHGGSIPLVDWIGGRTLSFIRNPDDCVAVDDGRSLPKLQAKVHIQKGEELSIAKLLVERGICGWVESEDVFTYRFQKVLNGLFGVAKSSQLEDGRSVLRVIMNLIPSNASMVQLKGGVKDLPQITQYLSLVLEQGEILQISQADMTAAFYLFGLPMRWMRYLCFNLKFSGAEIGKEKNKEFYLACGVLPMGWASAVSVMQEVSEGLLLHGGLPRNPQIRRTKPLPAWLVECIKKGEASSQAWWHVYLDNFFSGEKVRIGETSSRAKELHEAAEKVWQEVGVISSEKKRVSQVTRAEELGALFASEDQYFGASGERLVKLIQLTAVVLSRPRPPIKWLQVVCGRWVHIFQFRRVGMCTLHYIWSWISGKKIGGKGIMKARKQACDVPSWCLPISLRSRSQVQFSYQRQ